MSRYVIRPRAHGWVEGDYVVRDSSPLEVNPEGDGAKEVDTGLVTLGGDPIWRLQPPIGFGRNEEWS